MERTTNKKAIWGRRIAAGTAVCIAAVIFCHAPAMHASADWNSSFNSSLIVAESLKKDPPNCTVDLIDYWAKNNGSLTQATPDQYADESTSNGSYGINSGHYLTFGAQTGAWNAWTGDAASSSSGTFASATLDGAGKAYRGIVNYNLGDDGYPRLALGEYAWVTEENYDNSDLSDFDRLSGTRVANESLAYLFNPDNTTTAYSQSARRGYADVKGLFRYGGTSGSADMTGYYWFDSNENFAEMHATYNEKEFDYYADTTTDEMINSGTYEIRLYTQALKGSGFAGQFAPLNYVNRTKYELFTRGNNGNSMTAQTGYDTVRARVNHYFGMAMEVEFMQPAGYQVGGKDMTFTFAGDDDVWIFCDDVLVADLGGNHNSLACDINFTTGEIVYYSSQDGRAAYNDVWRVDYLSNCFGVDLDYGRTAKGWTATGKVPASETELQRYYNNTHPWASGRSGATLDFTMATTNAWHEGNESNTAYGTFEELTRHTLKFYFLEGGNYSNCMLKFNLSAIADE